MSKHVGSIMYISCESCQCGDDGYWIEADSEGNPQQVQCEFCYTIPWSVFNLRCIQEQYERKNEEVCVENNDIPF